jgi:hypothetical protein
LLSAKDNSAINDIIQVLLVFRKRSTKLKKTPRNLKRKTGEKEDIMEKSGRTSETSSGELPMEFRNLLKEIKFPVKRNELVDQARGKVSDETLADLGMILDKQYSNADDVMKAYTERVSKAAR